MEADLAGKRKDTFQGFRCLAQSRKGEINHVFGCLKPRHSAGDLDLVSVDFNVCSLEAHTHKIESMCMTVNEKDINEKDV